MSKILCFLAMPHHTRFLQPVLDGLEKKGHEIIYFTTIADFPFEGELRKQGKPYKLLQQYLTPDRKAQVERVHKKFIKEWTTEKVFAWPDMVYWPLALQSNLMRVGIEDYFGIEEMILQEKPDMLVALHERNRWGKIMGYLGCKNHVPFLTFQEGDYYEKRLSFSSHTEYSTAFLVWGQRTMDMLSSLGAAKEKMYLIGNTHLDVVRKKGFSADKKEAIRKELGVTGDKPLVMIFVGLQWSIMHNIKVWNEFFENFPFNDVTAVMSWHPKLVFNSFHNTIKPIFEKAYPQIKMIYGYDPYKSMPASDIIVSLSKSTTVVEALWYGKPIFSVGGFDGEGDIYEGWGISYPLGKMGNWEPLIKYLKDGPDPEVTKRVEVFLADYFYKHNDVAIERAIELAEVMLKTKVSDMPYVTDVPFDFNQVPIGVDFFSKLSDEERLQFYTRWSGWLPKKENFLDIIPEHTLLDVKKGA